MSPPSRERSTAGDASGARRLAAIPFRSRVTRRSPFVAMLALLRVRARRVTRRSRIDVVVRRRRRRDRRPGTSRDASFVGAVGIDRPALGPGARNFSGVHPALRRRSRSRPRRRVALACATHARARVERACAAAQARSPENRAVARFPGLSAIPRGVRVWTYGRPDVPTKKYTWAGAEVAAGRLRRGSAGVRELLVSPQKFVDTRFGQY